MTETNEGFSWTEKLLILICLALFASMTYAYFTDISFKTLFKQKEEDVLSKPIGKIQNLSGSVSRQRAREFEFKTITLQDVLFPNDTLITGGNSFLSIALDDGQKFELGPNSLIKLAFDYDFSAGGVVQRATIQVTPTTNPLVKALPTKKPVIAPAPFIKQVEVKPLQIISALPAPNSTFQFTSGEYASLKKMIPIHLKLSRALVEEEAKAKLSLRLSREIQGVMQEVSNNPISVASLSATATIALNSPGKYQWQVKDSKTKSIFQSTFTVNPVVEIIQLEPTQGTTNEVTGSATKKDFEGLTLRWRPIHPLPKGAFSIRVFKNASDKPALKLQSMANEVNIRGDQLKLVQRGRWAYRVEKIIRNGFVGVSNRGVFGYDFFPPKLISPEDNTTFGTPQLTKSFGFIVLTWSKTNYTDAYMFELFMDSSGGDPVLRRKVRDNVYSLRAPSSGQYYWQVRSVSKGLVSEPSERRAFAVNQ